VNSPKISVLIPTYNYARFLPEAIESVLAQEFWDFELLIVDDCSTDNTTEVIKPFCARDARVRFAVNPVNLGMVNNWNYCLELARGEYIKFLFGDDKLFHPQALGKMISLLEDHPSATLAASARTILDEHSRAVDAWRALAEGRHNGRKIIVSCLIEDANLVGEPSAVLFRKKDARRGFDPKYRQIVDIEMWFYLLEKGDLAYTREPLCAFRQHARQQSALNDTAGFARKERALFFASCAAKPWLPRKIHFYPLFALRRLRQKHPGLASRELLEEERCLITRLGRLWYSFYWTRYKLTRPFRGLNRSIKKRFAR
jgi:glycosyltransferase involved in cell wall biosynthesis